MIIDKDNKWAICTPPKTGTMSLEALLVKEKFAIRTKFHHTAHWEGSGERIMTVRNPLERWASMYWFTKQKAHRGIYLGKYANDINHYASEWLYREHRDPHPQWTDDQWTFAYKFSYGRGIDKIKIFKQEEGMQQVVDYIFKKYFFAKELFVPQIPHVNATKVKLGWKETSKLLLPHFRELIENFCYIDIKKFNY